MAHAHSPIVSLRAISKRFAGIAANDQVELDIHAAEVHVLLGENGAGKSTLVAMLCGLLQPDAGHICVDGVPTTIRSPQHALSLGIGTVFQHSMLVPSLTVAQNLALGGPWWQRPKLAELAERAAALAKPLGIEINMAARLSELSLGEQQHVEIVRALLRNSRVLVLDEATSMLSPGGIATLGTLMRRLAARGYAVLFITHKLGEAVDFGDRVSVLKLGRKVGEIAPAKLRSLARDALVTEIVTMMFSRPPPDDTRSISGPDTGCPHAAHGATVLAVNDLCVAPRSESPGLEAISFAISRGEILGVAGMEGHGQQQLAEALAGQRAALRGRIRLHGQSLEGLSVGARRKLGLRYVSDDRLGEGTVGAFPVSLNCSLKQIGEPPGWRHGIERPHEILAHARKLVERYDVRTPGLSTPIGQLSGGNIQKVLIARELTAGAHAIIFNKPTYGLDLANTLATRQHIRKLAENGLAVLLISTDLQELTGLCHRIAVMAQGKFVGIVQNDHHASQRVGALMMGIAA